MLRIFVAFYFVFLRYFASCFCGVLLRSTESEAKLELFINQRG